MDGRVATVLLGMVLPGGLIGVTIAYFSSNPVALVTLFAAIIVAGFYLLSYD